MRRKRTHDVQASTAGGELHALLERQRAELESCVADADQRVVEARAQADERVERQRRESETLVERERHEARTRIAEVERRLEKAEARAATAEEKLKGKAMRQRAARKLAEAQHALEQERAEGERLREECERLGRSLESATEQERELRRTHDGERAALENRVNGLEERAEALEAALGRERAGAVELVADLEQRLGEAGIEHEREHSERRELEEFLAAERASLTEVRRELEDQTVAATNRGRRMEELEHELRQALQEAGAERAGRQQVEQQLETLLQSETDARRVREQQASELEQAQAAAVARAESAERLLGEAREKLERARLVSAEPAGQEVAGPFPGPRSAPADHEAAAALSPERRSEPADEPDTEAAPARELSAAEHAPNGPPPDAPDTTRPKRSHSVRGRWRRRARLPCAVCLQPPPDVSDGDLTASGWTLTGAGTLCPECREGGWQFPGDAAMPFRQVDAWSSG